MEEKEGREAPPRVSYYQIWMKVGRLSIEYDSWQYHEGRRYEQGSLEGRGEGDSSVDRQDASSSRISRNTSNPENGFV